MRGQVEDAPQVSTPRLEDGAIYWDRGTRGETDWGKKVNSVWGSLRLPAMLVGYQVEMSK